MYHLGDKIVLIIFLIILIIIILNIKGGDNPLKLDFINEPNNNEKDKNKCTSQELENNLQNYREITKIYKKNLENKPQNYKERTKIHKEYKESIKKNKELIKRNKKLYNTIRTLCLNTNDFIELDAIARIVQDKWDIQTLKDSNERKSVIVTDVEECYKQLKIENKELKKLEQKLRAVSKYDELLKYFECNSNFNSKEKRLSFYNQNVDIKLKDGNKLDSYDKIKICVRQAILHNLSNAKKIRIITDKNNFKSSMGDSYLYDQFPFQDIKSSSYTIDRYNDRDDDYYVPNWNDDEDLDDNIIYFDAESEVGVTYDDCYEDYNSDRANKNYERYESDVINLNLPDFKNFRYPKLNILIYNKSHTYQEPKISGFLSFQWIIDKNFLDSTHCTIDAEKKRFINHLKSLSNYCEIDYGYDYDYYYEKGENEPSFYYCNIGISFGNCDSYCDFEENISRNLREVCNLLIELNNYQVSEQSRWDILNKKIPIFFDYMYKNLILKTESIEKLSSVSSISSTIQYKNAKDFLFRLYKKKQIVSKIKSLNMKGFFECNDLYMITFDSIHTGDVLLAVILFKEDLSINFCYLQKLNLDIEDSFEYKKYCISPDNYYSSITTQIIDKNDLSYLIILGDPIYYCWDEMLGKDKECEISDELESFFKYKTPYADDYINRKVYLDEYHLFD